MASYTENVFIVIPTIRDLEFLKDWKQQFNDTTIIVCEDRPTKTIHIPKVAGKKIFHYSWKEIDSELGKKSWIVPRKVSGIRNFGFWKAYEMGATIIITLDDDCYPVGDRRQETRERGQNESSKALEHKNTESTKAQHPLIKGGRPASPELQRGEPKAGGYNSLRDTFIEQHVQNLSLKVPARWTNTYPDARYLYTRGMPYVNRSESPVMLSHGLWTNILDFDAPTHLQHLEFRAEFAEHFLQIIPKEAYFPMCSMNLAFRREITPMLYFPLMSEDNQGSSWGYHRFDDIWAGIFAKKIMDHLGYGVVNGIPFVEHRKASNVFTNLVNEAKGIATNEVLWQVVDQVKLTKRTPKTCYIELAEQVEFPSENYFKKLREAMIIWAELF